MSLSDFGGMLVFLNFLIVLVFIFLVLIRGLARKIVVDLAPRDL